MPSSLLMISTGHGDRDRMIKETRHKYANIAPSFWSCLSRCQECQKKSKRRMTESLQNSCQGTKQHMVDQNHLTKSCVLRLTNQKQKLQHLQSTFRIWAVAAHVISEIRDFLACFVYGSWQTPSSAHFRIC